MKAVTPATPTRRLLRTPATPTRRLLRLAKVVTPATHTRRLLRLAEILRQHKDGDGVHGTEFNMRTFAEHDKSHKPTLKTNFCGTTACALGHAAMDPTFR